MIISMRLHATREEVEGVRLRIEEFGYKVHSIDGEERVVIGVVGVGDVTACLESLEAMPGVEKAVRISAPYKFVSREFRPTRTEIAVAMARAPETRTADKRFARNATDPIGMSSVSQASRMYVG